MQRKNQFEHGRLVLTDEERNTAWRKNGGNFAVPECEKMREKLVFNPSNRDRPTTKAKLNMNFSLGEFLITI